MSDVATFLSGFAFAKNALIFRNGGLTAYQKQYQVINPTDFTDGRYSLTVCRENEIFVKADPFGQEPVFYYDSPTFWAISNSFYELSRRVRNVIGGINPYLPATKIFFVQKQSLFGGQLISNNTIVEGIKVLPLRHYIKIQNKVFTVEPEITTEIHSLTKSDYLEAVERFYSSTCSRMIALSNLMKGRSVMDISGGQDTRALFGILIRSHALREAVSVRSNPKIEEDFGIASELARKYQLQLSKMPARTSPEVSASEGYELWMQANAGVYVPSEKPLCDAVQAMIHFTGGNFLARAYLERPLSERINSWKQYLTDDELRLLEREFETALAPCKADRSDTGLLAFHYKHYRARFHYGRAWFQNLTWTDYALLLSLDFEDVVIIGEKLGLKKDAIMRDVIVGCDSALARHRFDSGNKPFTDDEVLSSACAGLVTADIPTFNIEIFSEPLSYAPDNTEANEKKDTFRELVLDKFLLSKKRAVDSAIFPKSLITKAEDEYKNEKSLRKMLVILSMLRIYNLE